jgi:hypothetical protein
MARKYSHIEDEEERMEKEIEDMRSNMSPLQKALHPLVGAISGVFDLQQRDSYYDFLARESNPEYSTEKIQYYYSASFANRSKTYFLIILIVSLSYIGFAPTVTLQGYGLMLDAIGATIIARGLFRGPEGIKTDTAVRGGGGAYGGSPYRFGSDEISSTTDDSVDGFFGTIILIMGFVLQFVYVTI